MKLNFTVDTQNEKEVVEAIGILLGFTADGASVVDDKKAEVKTKTPAKPVKPKTKATPTPDMPKGEEPVKEPVKEEVKPEPKEAVGTVDLGTLKAKAKEAVAKTDVDTVKKVISRYGAKLAVVTENNYEALYNDLEATIKGA